MESSGVRLTYLRRTQLRALHTIAIPTKENRKIGE
jgi:hypothetical protein